MNLTSHCNLAAIRHEFSAEGIEITSLCENALGSGTGPLSTELSETEVRCLISVREAARAVFLNLLGYEVGPAGVWLHEYGGCCDFSEVPSEADIALISLAGMLAEMEWISPGSQTMSQEWESSRHHMQHLMDAVYSPGSTAMRMSKGIRPSDPHGILTRWVMQVGEILGIPGVWQSIEALANLLSEKRSLNCVQVTTTIEGSLWQARCSQIRRILSPEISGT